MGNKYVISSPKEIVSHKNVGYKLIIMKFSFGIGDNLYFARFLRIFINQKI
jgi:hypothetical protein